MQASKVRNRSEVRVSTKYPNEVEEMLQSMPTCAVIDYAQVFNRNDEWIFWVETPTEKLASKLRSFLSEVNMEEHYD